MNDSEVVEALDAVVTAIEQLTAMLLSIHMSHMSDDVSLPFVSDARSKVDSLRHVAKLEDK